jgi:large subunit ribosomal protein L3
VLDIKTEKRDGYSALQLGFDDKSERRTKRPEAGQFSRAQCAPKRFVREIRITPEELEQFQVGQELSVDQIFEEGEVIDVTGTTKGKGFQGVMRRHHFAGFRATHGTHEYFRHGGSIGCRLTPGRVHKGKKMAGHMGNRRRTVQNLRVIDVNAERNLLLVRGAVPGAPNGYLIIKKAVKRPQIPFVLAAPATAEPAAPDAEPAPADQ